MNQGSTTLARNSTGLPPLDDVLGGGLVEASVVLLVGPAGSGKTSLTLQMLHGLGGRCLYATGEETREHVEGVARRIGALTPRLCVRSERDLTKIFTEAQEIRAQTIVVDTIQTMLCTDVPSRHGSPRQIKECSSRLVHYAKTNNTTIWIIGHVRANGDIAGPQTLEHDVDVVLKLMRNDAQRTLRCPNKNRFGPIRTSGVVI